MTIRRSAAAVGAVALGLFALSACTKPTPLATVTVGQDSVHSEASCYDNGKPLSQDTFKTCVNKTPEHTVKVHATDKLHLGVDPAIANKGWVVFSGSTQRTGVINKQTYYTFPDAGSLFVDSSTGQSSKTVELNLLETGAQNSGTAGVWKVKLELES